MNFPTLLLALAAGMALAAPAQALVSFTSRIDASLSATSVPEGVGIQYDFGNYSGQAAGFGSYTADWTHDFVIDEVGLSFTPSASGSTDALAVVQAESLNDGTVTLENLTDAISTVDFVLSYDLVAEVSRDSAGDEAKSYADLAIRSLDPGPGVSESIGAYAGGDYGRDFARQTGAWTFSIVLSPGQTRTLAIHADAMGELQDGFGAAPSVPLPGALPLAAVGVAAFGGVAALRRRRRVPG